MCCLPPSKFSPRPTYGINHRSPSHPHLLPAACGGDGTVGWILSVMDALDLPRPRPAIGIIPLGTGNDLARSLGWGGKYRDKPLRKVLLDIAKAEVVELDRWSLKVTRLPYSGK